MRILHINLGKGFRGGERQTFALIQALDRDVENRAIVRQGHPLQQRLEALGGVRVSAVPNSLIAALLRSNSADLIHIHEGRSVPVAAVRRRLSGTPFVVTRRVPRIPGGSAATRWVYRSAACVAAVSDAVARGMQAYDQRLHVETVHDCVPPLVADTGASAAIRRRAGGRLLIGHVGELDDRHKGQKVLIEAIELLGERAADTSFVLVGQGPDEQELRELARGLKQVSFVGWVDNIADYYDAMDVLVFPSRFEALGSAILEAMSFGVPVVASDVDGIPEIVRHEQNGLLAPPGNAQRLAAELARIIEDAALRQQLGNAARETARLYSAAAMARRYRTIYASALGSVEDV